MASERPRAAMILAAGRGERMRPLTDVTAKPLLRVHGQPLIERHLIRLVSAGIDRVVINLAWLGSQIRDYLGDGTRYGATISYSEEAPRALETAGGIFRALPLLSPGPFAVVNGDIYTDFPFETLALGAHHDAHLVLVPNPSYLKGDFGIEQGEAREAAAELHTFSGIAVYRPAFFADCVDGVFPLKPLMLRSMSAGRCSAQLYAGAWEDVGTPERLAALNSQSA
ncbi:MAG: N-acetyl-alpha-D-muramate 1-phosphate uridylyltransferase [Gammaproteobacteria bacterium]|jgi:MurNAc alpha-1-phosphate uridylyltransferase|nr:N-acetyl-alpha-D-muramate 1-phosphate uridylyltransferase [Gammaproteobacteria bacterium]